MTEANIQSRAIDRPAGVMGALSPYPTVVMVTADHQKAAPMPLCVGPPNWSVL